MIKTFKHIWGEDFFLLHIQLNNNNLLFNSIITREYTDGKSRKETINVQPNVDSYRFILSRTHPKECNVTVEYPSGVVLEAFKLDDRAYYPTEAFFVD
jgi:hypothetical protein